VRNTGTLVSLKLALLHRRLLEAVEVHDPIAARPWREIMARSQ